MMAFRTPPSKRRTLEDTSPETREVWLNAHRPGGGSDSGQYSGASYLSHGQNSSSHANASYNSSTELPAWLRREKGASYDSSAEASLVGPKALICSLLPSKF